MGLVGQLDQENAGVAEAGDLGQGGHLAGAAIFRRAELGHAIHHAGHLLAQPAGEVLANGVKAGVAVFHAVVQQGGNRPGFVGDQPVHQRSHPDAVGFKVGFAAQALLPRVKLLPPAVSLGNCLGAGGEGHGLKFPQQPGADFVDVVDFNHGRLLYA